MAGSFGDRQWKAAALTTFLHHHPTPTPALHNFLLPLLPRSTLFHNRIPRLLFSFPFLLLPAAAADPSFLSSPRFPIAGHSSFSSPTATTYCAGGRTERERRDGFLGASKNHMMPLPPPPSFPYLGIFFSSACADPSFFFQPCLASQPTEEAFPRSKGSLWLR